MVLGRRLRAFRRTELGGLARDSFHVGVWQAATSVADLVQLALITHLLGLTALGRLALAMSFVVLVGQFFDVRVGTAATKFGAARLAAGDIRGLAGLFQLSYVVDTLSGVLSFSIIAILAPVVGPRLVGEHGALFIVLYGLTLLISTADDSSASLLRLLDRFRLVAGYSVGLEVVRVAAVGIALIIAPSVTSVLVALVVYDLAGACVNLVAANAVFQRTFNRQLRRLCLAAFVEKRAMFGMVFQTNIVSYARIAQVQLPTLLLGALSTPTQVAYYKVGSSASTMVGRIADPGYVAVLPRLARLWAAGRATEMRRLLRRSTIASLIVMVLALFAVIALRNPILGILGGSGGHHAAEVLVLLAVGQAVSGTLFWNTGLLFAAGRVGVVTAIAVLGMAMQVGLLVPLTLSRGAEGAATALLVSYVLTNVAAALLALRTTRQLSDRERARPPIDAPSAVSSRPL